jgi:hypothetical protein
MREKGNLRRKRTGLERLSMKSKKTALFLRNSIITRNVFLRLRLSSRK